MPPTYLSYWTFSASAALADDEIYLRSEDALYCLVEEAPRDLRPEGDAEANPSR
ncbi:MAG: hypothetical protein AAF604_23425 [Acidobacteriota bacterium]